MNIKDMNDLMTQINEKSKHVARLERVKKDLKGKDAERAESTQSNLRRQIIELQELV